VRESLSLLLTGYRLRLKGFALYRMDFAITLIAVILHDGSSLLLMSVIFSNVAQLQGWSFNEMIFIWGFAVTSRNLQGTFFNAPSMISVYIHQGWMDVMMVRPRRLTLQLAAYQGVNHMSLGRLAVGIAAVVFVLPALRLQWWCFLYLPVAIAASSVIMLSLGMLVMAPCFWFINANSLWGTVAWVTQFGQYPTEIFPPFLRFVFSWILPYAMTGFLPAAFMLRGAEYRIYGLLLPVLALVFLCVFLLVWRAALRHYQSTGS
jgi:ABC-2 type transport system permease protein